MISFSPKLAFISFCIIYTHFLQIKSPCTRAVETLKIHSQLKTIIFQFFVANNFSLFSVIERNPRGFWCFANKPSLLRLIQICRCTKRCKTILLKCAVKGAVSVCPKGVMLINYNLLPANVWLIIRVYIVCFIIVL